MIWGEYKVRIIRRVEFQAAALMVLGGVLGALLVLTGWSAGGVTLGLAPPVAAGAGIVVLANREAKRANRTTGDSLVDLAR